MAKAKFSVLLRFVQITFCSFIFLLGVACVWWGWTVFPIFVEQSNVQRLAPQVIGGQSFDVKLLERILPPDPPSFEKCRASALKASTVVRLRLVESAIARADRELVAETRRALLDSVRKALSCSPTDPFLWFLQYWLDVTENGFNERALRYLRMSYVWGSNEGWIAVKRNGFSLAIYDYLPADLAAKVVPEFVSLVRSGFDVEAASNLAGPGWPVREVLVAALASIEERRRHDFAKYLRAEGVQVDIPRVVLAPRRPWN